VVEQPFGAVGLAGNAEPRCPCVLLLDVSHSMNRRTEVGGPSRIALLNEGVRAYEAEIVRDNLVLLCDFYSRCRLPGGRPGFGRRGGNAPVRWCQ
jgi:hypothetical protein